MIGPARCFCSPVHEDVSVAGEEFAAAEADVEEVVMAVELVGVVAGVAEHASRPPRRGRRLQRGGGVAGEASLEVAVGVHGDGVVVRHSLGGLALFSSANWCSAFSLCGWERGATECGEDEREGLYILEGDADRERGT